jgi:hypothetical protein
MSDGIKANIRGAARFILSVDHARKAALGKPTLHVTVDTCAGPDGSRTNICKSILAGQDRRMKRNGWKNPWNRSPAIAMIDAVSDSICT